jgi:hypothetical protein
MWFKLSLLVLVCVMMVVLNFGGMLPCVRQPANETSDIVQAVDQGRGNMTTVSFSAF